MESLEKKGNAYPAFEIDFNGSNHAQPDANGGRGVYAIACSFSSETSTISDWLMRQVAGKA